jgi:hypothetical protein
MVVEWRDYIKCIDSFNDHKVNYTCTAGSVDEAMGKARSAYGDPGRSWVMRSGLVVTSIYSE